MYKNMLETVELIYSIKNDYEGKTFKLKTSETGKYTVINLFPMKHSAVDLWEVGIVYKFNKETYIKNKEGFDKAFQVNDLYSRYADIDDTNVIEKTKEKYPNVIIKE